MAQMNLQQQYEDIHRRAVEAVAHWDAMPAWGIYRDLEKFLEALPTDQQKESELAREIVRLKRELLTVGFPALPRDEAVKLFREHILDFFQVDVDLQERLLTRYIFVGYGDKDDERKCLQEALLKNQERLGQFTLGEWAKLFDRSFKPETRDKNALANFFIKTGEVAALQKEEQIILRKILSVYENFLSKEVLGEIDLAMMNAGENAGQSSLRVVGQNASLYGRSDQPKTVNIPLLQAISKYEKLGNQLITAERIKVKSQAEPVRPSLLYWLKYYRDELGIGQHSGVERGEFLFRSENGKKLSAEERERVSLVLKSVEDYLPLAIDAERQEIIFPVFRGVVTDNARKPDVVLDTMLAGNYAQAFPSATRPDQNAAKAFPSIAPNSYRGNVGRGAYSVPSLPIAPVRQSSDGSSRMASGPTNVSFSAGHIFPAEKEAEENKAPTLPASRPVSGLASSPTSLPENFRIRPMSHGRDESVL
jgi:hypothetical protein